MRTKLASEKGKRKKFRAVFERMGKKTNFKGHSEDTILLKTVVDLETNTMMADHIWFSYTRGFEKISLTEGAIIEFEARIKEYKKGYVNRSLNLKPQTIDYKLSHPTKIKKVAL
jgi:hypothetical protein